MSFKILFTEVVTEPDGGSYKGIAAYYEATDSDGAGNIAVDSGGIAPTDSYQPTYASLAAVEALTQTQIYNDFYPTKEVDSQILGEIWVEGIQETLDNQISIVQQQNTPTFESVDNITDQTPITVP